MFRCKRDVDRHVTDLEEKFPSVTERSLKYFTVARLYFNVGETDLALKFLDKFCQVRPSSPQAFKFRGQILEKAAENSEDQASEVKKSAALEAYKTSYHLDLSQKELLLRICELSAHLPINDVERTRYWVDQGEKLFPRNKVVAKLRDKMRSATGEDDTNFNGGGANGQASTAETSPGTSGREDDVDADNSILWSTSRLGNSFALNGSYRMEDAINSTPGRNGNPTAAGTGSARRFPPRPSPERLANQIRQVESAQEKMSAAVLENSRSSLETQESILAEVRKTREDVSRNFRENTEAIRDLRSEMSSIWREMRDEFRRNASKKQEVIIVKDDKPAPAAPPPAPAVHTQELQEMLAQQVAWMQMASMFHHPARPPMPPLAGAPGPQMLPPLPQQPVPMVAPPVAAAPVTLPAATPANVVITSSDKLPAVGSTVVTPSLPAVNIPPQQRLGVKPQPVVSSPVNQHSYQINISSNQPSGSPFASDKEGPAVPISTSSILASIPAPVISAVTPKTTTATSKPSTVTPVSAAPSSFDKFKPKVGSWECGGCFIRNNPEVIQCPACQTAKPGHEEEVKAKEAAAKPTMTFGESGGFKFGNVGGAGASSTPNNNSGFTFGTPTTTPQSSNAPAAAPAASKPSPFSGFSFGTGSTSTPTTGGFSFGGVAAAPASTEKAEPEPAQNQEDESHDDSNAHDPHFEPIIPLPELVQVRTGEEDEEVKFKHRAKVYRFDKDTKEWKERGVGDLKILYHPQNKSYRVLLRREQVHKIACNHNITTDMTLEPMAKSETAVTWFAMDYSDEGEAKVEKLAARFKLSETKDEFKKAFEDAQNDLKNKPATPRKSQNDEGQDDDGGDELSFEGQGLKLNSAADAANVVAKIKAKKNMKTLTFSGNTIGIEAAEAIGKALEGHPELKYAHWKDMFTGRMKTEIPPALKHLSRGMMMAKVQLVELDLSDNAFGPIGMDGIVDLLKSSSCFTLQILKLNNTGCGVTGGKVLAKTLMECYNASKGQLALKVFILGRSRQENEGAIALAEVFKAMKSLEHVEMPQNGIYFEGITALADAFANNPNLKYLNMNDNTLTEKGAKALADALPKLQKLEVLNLGDCLLKTEGARLIAYALKNAHLQLRELNMESNEIRLAGGFAIVDAIANKQNLKVLNLDTNQFGSDGCGRIMKKLENAGKKHVMEDIEDDEEPEDSEEENQQEEEEEGGKVETLSSMNFGSGAKPASIFGGNSTPGNKTETSSIFGNTSGSANASIFGGSATPASPATNSLFGGANSSASTTPSLFGGNSSIFGQSNAAKPSIFGAASTTPSAGIFGNAAKESSGGIFGASTTPAKTGESSGIDLSASKDLPSFASLGGNSGGFAFGKKTEGFSFDGAGASVFGGAKPASASPNKSATNDEDNAEDNDHDPHFEPIIPLPELVTTTTGEEDEEVIFKHRAKVYRFDKDVKQWKERGVGDIKILHHVSKNSFRILLRRDQVHKIACNHYITQDQKLEPMASSETALTWFAMDFSEDEANGQLEKLAVKFKLAETKDEFKKAFEEAQEKLKNPPARPAVADNEDENDDGEYDDDETADEEEDSDNTMFERVCTLKEMNGDKEELLGKAALKILYDEDVYGARIIAVKVNASENEDEVYLCNHLIAIQTNVDVDEESKSCSWSGLDFSADPPRYRKFVAVFDDASGGDDAQMEFVSVFQEGKELAEQSEILELPENTDPRYYGQGGDYDEDEA